MAQHLLIGDLAALLIVVGLTGPLLQPVLALRGLRWLRVLANPLVALPLWALNLYIWHLAVALPGRARPASCSTRSSTPCFFVFGLAMWMPLLRPAAEAGLVRRRREARSTSSRRASPAPSSPTSSCGRTRRSTPTTRPARPTRDHPLADQGAAGMLMMVEAGVVTLGRPRLALLPLGAAGHRAPGACSTSPTSDGVALTRRRAERAVRRRPGRPPRERIRGA